MSSVSATCGVTMQFARRPERMPVGQRLGIGHVEARAAEAARLERGDEGVGVDEPAARDVHEHAARAASARALRAPMSPRDASVSAAATKTTSARCQRIVEPVRRSPCAPRPATGCIAAPHDRGTHVERLQQPQELHRDAAGAEDHHLGAVEAAPALVGLPATGTRPAAGTSRRTARASMSACSATGCA